MTAISQDNTGRPQGRTGIRSEIVPFTAALMVASLFIGVEYKTFVVLRPFDFIWLLSIATIILKTLETGRFPRPPLPSYILFFFLLLAYSSANALVQNSGTIAVKESIQAIQIALLYYALAISLASKRNQKIFFKYLFFLLLLIALSSAIYHIAIGSFGSFKLLGATKLVYGVLTTLAVATIATGSSSRKNTLYALVSIVLMLISGERKGWVAAAAGIGSAMMLKSRRLSMRRKLSLVFALIAMLVLIASSVAALYNRVPMIERQFGSLADVYYYTTDPEFTFEDASTLSNRGRLFVIESAIRLMKEHLWFGIGVENFRSILEATTTEDPRFTHGAHNEYLRYAAEGGLVGLALYLAGWLAMMRKAHVLAKKSGRDYDSITGRIVSLIYYGAAVNIFLAGGILNIIFFLLPAALLCNIKAETNRTPSRTGIAT